MRQMAQNSNLAIVALRFQSHRHRVHFLNKIFNQIQSSRRSQVRGCQNPFRTAKQPIRRKRWTAFFMPRHRVTRNKVRFGCRPQSNFRLRRSAIRKHRFRTFQSINFLSNRNDQRWRNTDEHEIERSDLGQRGNKINRISSKRNFEMFGVGITPKNLESLRFERHSDGCTDQPGSNDAYLQNGIPRESLIGILQDSMKMGRETWSKPIASSVQKLCVGRLEVTAEPKSLSIGPDDQRLQS